MSYQVLARKWRPKKFQEVIGQGHVTRALQNAILKDQIGHAYMFVGTRGVGKTSIARIFAKAIRCENKLSDGNACEVCKACLDFDTETSMNVIEIDGASNNSVDNIRDLISNAQYLPTSGKYKIYIIDEVHMLSTNAFNALLKTLEEPPAHVVFVFATTEAQKLLGTVLSRCQRFDFRNVSVNELNNHVKEICKKENIKFEKDELIVKLSHLGRGSVRDTLSLLDQILTMSMDNIITEEAFTYALGVAGPSSIKKIATAIFEGNSQECSKVLRQLLEENIALKNIVSSILDELFNQISENKNFAKAELIWIYESVAKETSWIFQSVLPEKAFEVLLMKISLRREFFNLKIGSSTQTIEKKTEEIADRKEIPTVKGLHVGADKNWENFLAFLYEKSPASASNLEQGNILKPLDLSNGELHVDLGFGYSGLVFLDYLSEVEVNQKIISNLAEFFNVEQDKIFLNLKNVQEHENFISRAEVKEKQEEIDKEEQIESFKNNPLLKEAEKIFNSKIDKVIIDKK